MTFSPARYCILPLRYQYAPSLCVSSLNTKGKVRYERFFFTVLSVAFIIHLGRDNLVGIAIRYGLDDPGTESR
jgi:hypothetical protein